MPDSDDRPLWIPYEPPPPEGWERVWMWVRRLAFPVAVILFGGALVVVFATEWEPSWRSLDASSQTRPNGVDAESPRTERLGPSVDAEGREGRRPEGLEAGVDTAFVTVQAEPSGATVRLNGRDVGAAPVVGAPVSPGRYLVEADAPGHYRTDTVVVVEAGTRPSYRLALVPRRATAGRDADRAPRPAAPAPSEGETSTSPPPSSPPPAAEPLGGRLRVTSEPSGARVVVDGRYAGTTPLMLDSVETGARRVIVERDGYATWTQTADVTAGATATLRAALDALPATLRVLVRPWGSVYVDDTLRARDLDVWYETELPPGSHRVTVVHPALGRRERTVTLAPGTQQSIIIDLQVDDADDAPGAAPSGTPKRIP